MLRCTPPEQRSHQNRAAAVPDGTAPHKRRCSAAHEVYEQVLPGPPQSGADVYCTESNNMTIDRICLAGYWLMLDISCSAFSLTDRIPKEICQERMCVV